MVDYFLDRLFVFDPACLLDFLTNDRLIKNNCTRFLPMNLHFPFYFITKDPVSPNRKISSLFEFGFIFLIILEACSVIGFIFFI